MLSAVILLTLAVPGQAAAVPETLEELAIGTIRSITSAQAAYRSTHPDAGER